jgi:glutathione S-transferase
MSEFIVHSIPGSPYGRAVLATLEEKGAAYRLNPVLPGTFNSEPHISRHPFGKVPVLQHSEFMLYETQAILRYLDRVLPAPSLTPEDSKAAARMDQVINVNDWYFFNGVANTIGFQRVVGPKVMGLTPNEAICAAAMPRAHQVFGEFGRLLADQPYFGGEIVSLADILLACQIDFFEGLPEWEPLTANNANLVAWLGRMNSRPSMKATTWVKVDEMAKAA